MSLNNKNKKVTIFLILVIIIFTCFFSIKILTKIKNNMEIEDVLIKNISDTNWPKEVPIIQSKFVNITKTSDKAWAINIKEFISYEAFKAYLVELYSEGFEPIEEMGSDNPKRLSTNPPTEDDFVLIWCGKSEQYNIEAYWFNKSSENSSEQEVEMDCVTILLYSNSSMNVKLDEEISKEQNNSSGDYHSGDILEIDEISGDKVLHSGE